MKISDYFAELFIAGRLADAGWNIYFPHRDQGFDFIITKRISTGELLIRPVQVKGKYPTDDKGDQPLYGYVGSLEIHPEMVLVIPFFDRSQDTPCHVAYMPATMIRGHSRGSRCQPALFKDGKAHPRRDHRVFFDEQGIENLALVGFREMKISGAAGAE